MMKSICLNKKITPSRAIVYFYTYNMNVYFYKYLRLSNKIVYWPPRRILLILQKLLNMRLRTLLLYIATSAAAYAAPQNVNWHNEASDTTVITEILSETAKQHFNDPGKRTEYIARKFLGKPYVAHTLESDTEELTVNLDELDCTTLVDVVMALSYSVGENRLSWQDFLYNLQRMRYRNGEINGYGSRLHYNCDWAIDNIHRGNFTDVTTRLARAKYIVRSIDFMSAHRDRYPALADSATFEKIQSIESNYRNHRFPYIKTHDLGYKDVKDALREGDILAFVSNIKNLDVTHMGIVVKENGTIKVLHASSTNGKVEISASPIEDFVKRNRNWIGIRIYRLKE